MHPTLRVKMVCKIRMQEHPPARLDRTPTKTSCLALQVFQRCNVWAQKLQGGPEICRPLHLTPRAWIACKIRMQDRWNLQTLEAFRTANNVGHIAPCKNFLGIKETSQPVNVCAYAAHNTIGVRHAKWFCLSASSRAASCKRECKRSAGLA